MTQSIVSVSGYPSLETCAQLTRLHLMDFQNNGAGLQNIDTSAQIQIALPSAIRSLYREFRNFGAPQLLRDNYLVTLPPVSSFVSPPNPQVQVQLSSTGFWDGWQVFGNATLPTDILFPLEVYEQQAGISLPFVQMHRPQQGLTSRNQTFALGEYEWRQDSLWFVGALCSITLRIRYMARMTTFASFTGTDFTQTYILIQDCEEYIGWQTAALIASAVSGENPQTGSSATAAFMHAKEEMFLLRNQNSRDQQGIEYNREPYEVNTNATGNGGFGSGVI